MSYTGNPVCEKAGDEMNEHSYVVSARDMSPEQLATIEARAILRFTHMRSVAEQLGNLTLAIAAR